MILDQKSSGSRPDGTTTKPVLSPAFSFGPSGREAASGASSPDSLNEVKTYREDLTGQQKE